jgi:putative ABC transport system substrate-binding protein
MYRRGSRLTRRGFVVGAGAAGLGLLAGCERLPWQPPQPPPSPVYRLGFLSGSSATTQAEDLEILRVGLRDLGYIEGQNLLIEYRWGDGSNARLVEPAAELARLPVDLFVVPALPPARIARDATSTVPILLVGAGDLVAAGLAASLARPGGTVTGLTSIAEVLIGKQLQLLSEAVPTMARVLVLYDVDPANGTVNRETYEQAARTLGVQVQFVGVGRPEDFGGVFAAAVREHTDALFLDPTPLFRQHGARIVELAAQHGLPAMYYRREFVESGGLMSYTGQRSELWRRAAYYVDRILKGTKPADLPVEQPMTFDFVVNQKTAQALGITFPNEIMLQVTEVVDP